ncbi:hypothetical protein HMPREF0774_2183, partial [Staphylococcus aureus subsp. aureus TCH130]
FDLRHQPLVAGVLILQRNGFSAPLPHLQNGFSAISVSASSRPISPF